jgi:hypothetical protein
LDTAAIYSGGYNGPDEALAKFFVNLSTLLNHTKGGGVHVAIEIDPASA